MAIGYEDLEQLQTDILQDDDKIKKLEDAIDKAIEHNLEQRKKLFSKKIKVEASFYLLDKSDADSRDLIKLLYDLKRLSDFLERYKQKGWRATYRKDRDTAGNIYLRFCMIVNPVQIKQRAADLLEEKTRHLTELKTEIMHLEAEIQFLTESPNSRDPLLLPETATQNQE